MPKLMTHAERLQAGMVRIDGYLRPEVGEALQLLCEREAEESNLPAERCKTAAISRAILERAERLKKRLRKA